jgi:hypothetical protein
MAGLSVGERAAKGTCGEFVAGEKLEMWAKLNLQGIGGAGSDVVPGEERRGEGRGGATRIGGTCERMRRCDQDRPVVEEDRTGRISSAAATAWQRRADEDGSLDENAVARGSRRGRRGRWQQTFRDVVGWMEEGR